MRITPLDVRKQDFRKAVRGFDCDEVRAFLSTLADEYETVLVDNKQIREMIMEQEDKIQEYQGMERNLRDTLMTAERVMQETRENATKKGDLIINDAEMKAQRVLEECRLRTEELRREMVNLRKEKESYLARFKSLAEAQIQFIESHRQDFKELDGRLVAMVDAVIDGVSVPAPATGDQPQAAPRPAAAPSAPAWTNPVGGAEYDDTTDEAPAAENTPAANEPDIWRDYQPLSRPEAPAAPAASAPQAAPEANPWATEGWADTNQAADQDQAPEAPEAAENADETDEAVAVLHEDEPKPEPANIW